MVATGNGGNCGVILLVMAYMVVAFVIKLVQPNLKAPQNEGVKQFVDKLERVMGVTGVSRFVIVFRVVRDIVRPRGKSYLQQVVGDSTSLHTDLDRLQKLFTD